MIGVKRFGPFQYQRTRRGMRVYSIFLDQFFVTFSTREGDWPASVYWRTQTHLPGIDYGPGWMIDWRRRPSDYLTFSERHGHGEARRKIGPLSIKRLPKRQSEAPAVDKMVTVGAEGDEIGGAI
jgi:hypothetical protein